MLCPPLVRKMSKLIFLRCATPNRPTFAAQKIRGSGTQSWHEKSRANARLFSWLGLVDVFQKDNTINYSKLLLHIVQF